MKYISSSDLESYERFYRANLINSISGLKQANLIGTINQNGIKNLAMFSSVIHLGANPALLAFIQRPITDTSHTYKNILHNKLFTINQVHTSILQQSHYTSAKFDDNVSEFEQCNLTPHFIENFAAPFVQESVVKIGLLFVEAIPITHNNTTMVIGQIQHIVIDEKLIEKDGNVDLELANAASVAGLETYYGSTKVQKFGYAKVGETPTLLNAKTN
jgi:flavin reductase (DIM6/NTAB) family NADH-FMN oxidoreductase RutF